MREDGHAGAQPSPGWPPPRKKALITGAYGSIGTALTHRLEAYGIPVIATDVGLMDVTCPADVSLVVAETRPDVIFHLAGAKHAPDGETDPRTTYEINITGTRNVLDAAAAHGCHVVTASTGKAADPETVYGASKLIAERMTLNAGGSVARFFNVRESSGNVFRIWEQIPESEPLPVAPCLRYFISIDQAVDLLLHAAAHQGRFAVDPGRSLSMWSVARKLYPTRRLAEIPPRRGDRIIEPLCAISESFERLGNGFARIVSPHDAIVELKAAA